MPTSRLPRNREFIVVGIEHILTSISLLARKRSLTAPISWKICVQIIKPKARREKPIDARTILIVSLCVAWDLWLTTSVIHRRRQPRSRSHEARGGWIDAMVREESQAHGTGLEIGSALVWVCPSSVTAPWRAIADRRLCLRRIMASGLAAPIRSEDQRN